MNIRVVTLRYSESLGGFPEEPLRQVLAGGTVVEQREYFYTHGGVPHLTLVLVMDGTPGGPSSGATQTRDREDPGDKLPEQLQPLYRSLRQWRNDRAKREGVPAYAIMRNIQLAAICRAVPRTLESLKQIDGVGEATVSKYREPQIRLRHATLTTRRRSKFEVPDPGVCRSARSGFPAKVPFFV